MQKIGKYKVWADRSLYYVRIIQFIMICYLTFKTNSMNPWLLVGLIIIGLMSLLWLDLRFILPSELDYLFHKNPRWRQLEKDIKEIKEKLLEK